MVVEQGHRFFVDELDLLTAEIDDPRLGAIVAGITAPLSARVCGRRGVGRSSVAAALDAAGVDIVDGPGWGRADVDVDVCVYVVAESVKAEDTAAIAAAGAPVLVVLNKADLPGGCGVADVADVTRARAEPMSALFALAARGGRLDDELWEALGHLAAQPADLRSGELFVGGPHPVPRRTRERLCALLDLSGIERMVELARRGGTAGQARSMLRWLSGVDRVVAGLEAVAAGAYHRRITAAVARLEALAVGAEFADRIDDFLVADATVAARMAAAVVDEHSVPGESALRRAHRWQAYRRAPVSAARQACAADIARGSVRAWTVTRGRP